MLIAIDTTILDITIPGEPQGKGRGRAVRVGAGVRVVTPKPTRSYEATVAQVAGWARKNAPWPVPGPLLVDIEAVHRRPGGAFRQADPDGRMWRPRKPDIDNVIKAILDGLGQAGVWQDDGQVVELRARQVDGAIVDRRAKTSEAPHVRVRVSRC